ncbi:MAG: YqeG family HAD IIIA-type phosphatase [Candidatus Margulisiibacteriota bacterium]
MNESWEKFKKLFKPNLVVKDIYNIDFEKVKSRGIKALLVDIDDTLIPRGINDVSPQVFEWIVALKEQGFKLCLTSNSYHPLRVKYFGETLGIPAISLGLKPFPFAFRRSLKILNEKPEKTAMIGDQLFMDILGANLLKIFTIYVKYVTPEGFFLRRWMRMAEEWVSKRV